MILSLTGLAQSMMKVWDFFCCFLAASTAFLFTLAMGARAQAAASLYCLHIALKLACACPGCLLEQDCVVSPALSVTSSELSCAMLRVSRLLYMSETPPSRKAHAEPQQASIVLAHEISLLCGSPAEIDALLSTCCWLSVIS